MQFVKEFLSGKSSQLIFPAVTASRLQYNLSVTRWHGDIRDPVPVVLLHELLGSGRSWSRYVETASLLPQLGHSLVSPTAFYAPDLPFHHRGALAARSVSSGSYFLDAASDIVEFHSKAVLQPCHLVGVGAGAKVAAVAALAMPQHVASLTLMVRDGDVLGEQSESTEKHYQASVDKLKILYGLLQSKSVTLAALEAGLKKSLPNEAERLALLGNVEEAPDGSVRIASHLMSMFQTYPNYSLATDEPLKKALSSSTLQGSATPVTVLHSDPQRVKGSQFSQSFPTATARKVASVSLMPENDEELAQLLLAVLGAQNLLQPYQSPQAQE